jgi:hypothetical protein
VRCAKQLIECGCYGHGYLEDGLDIAVMPDVSQYEKRSRPRSYVLSPAGPGLWEMQRLYEPVVNDVESAQVARMIGHRVLG